MKKEHLKYILHAVILIGIVIAAVKYLNGDKFMEAIRSFNYGYAPFILGLALVYLGFKAWRFVLLMRPISDLPWGVTFRGFVAGRAATLVPGGVAARAGLMHQAGESVATSSVAVLFSSLLDQALLITGALIASLWFPSARLPAAILLAVLVVVSLAFLIETSRRWLFNAADWVADKFNVLDDWHHFLETIPEIITVKTLSFTLALTALAFLIRVIALDLTIRGFGMNLDYPTLFLAFVIPTILARTVPIPGGVGVAEASMVGFLVSASELGPNTAAVVAIIYRIALIAFPALVGGLVYLLAWRGEEEETATSTASS